MNSIRTRRLWRSWTSIPPTKGIVWLIPQAHFATVFEMSPESFAAMGATAAKLARAVNETLQPDGLSLVQANGEVAGRCDTFTCMSCRGAQATIFSSAGIVTASGILCMPIPFISLLLPGASASGWRAPTRGSSETYPADQHTAGATARVKRA